MTIPILLLDGGLGTTLEAPPYNVQFTTETPLWSSHLLLTNPSTLRNVHRDFVDAGADIVLTATYQTSVEGFSRTDSRYTREDAVKYMRSAIPLARDAFALSHRQKSKPAKVALSLGPYGATMTPVSAEYTGLYPAEMDSESALREWHAERLRVWAEDTSSWDGVEYVAFETVRRADEVRAIRGAVREVISGSPRRKPWWIVGVFPAEEVDEVDVRQWVRAALGTVSTGDNHNLPRPWGIGLNCTRIGNVQRIVQIMEDELVALIKEGGFADEWTATRWNRPWLVLYPDGTKGEQYDPATKQWVRKADDTLTRPWEDVFWDIVEGVKQRGTWEGVIIGGCCRTGPGDIAALARKIDVGVDTS